MGTKRKWTILITGAGDFLGRRTVELAIEQAGISVIATDLPDTDLSNAKQIGANLRFGDPTRREDCKKLVKGVDVIVHHSPHHDPLHNRSASQDADRRAARNLARAGVELNVSQFVYGSTCKVYGTNDTVPVGEDARKSPDCEFGRSCLLTEQELEEYGGDGRMQLTVIRPSLIYGPGAADLPVLVCLAPFLLNQFFGFTPNFIGGPLINAVHIDDVAGAMLYVAGRPDSFGQAYNVSDNDWLRLGEFIEKIWEPVGVRFRMRLPMMKMPLKWLSIASSIAMPDFAIDFLNYAVQQRWEKVRKEHHTLPALQPRFDRFYFSYGTGDHVYDNARIQRLGYRLLYGQFDRGVQQTVAWYRENGWIPSGAVS